MSIQSFIQTSQGERSNYAQKLPSLSHTFGRTGTTLPSHPG